MTVIKALKRRIRIWLDDSNNDIPKGYSNADDLRDATETPRKRWGDTYESDRLLPNETDYNLPMGWSGMSDEDKCLWFTWERTARMAKDQDTAWGRGYDVRRRETNRTSSDQYRMGDDERYK